jgi:hypothetical protein
MSDTVRFITWIDSSVPTATLFSWHLPFKIGRHGDQDDFFYGFGPDGMKPPASTRPKSSTIFQEWMTLVSRTGAGFKARGVWHPTEPARLGGYEISMNVPTCMVGHNVLLENSVPRAAELALLQFKLLLLDQVTHPAALDAFDPERIELLSVTPTECFRGGTREGAHQGRLGFKALSELLNKENGQ